MKSEWSVQSTPIGDEMMYRGYRLADINAVDHAGNREYASDFTKKKAEASALAVGFTAEERRERNHSGKIAVIMESIDTSVYAIQPEEDWRVAIYHARCEIEEKSSKSCNSQSQRHNK